MRVVINKKKSEVEAAKKALEADNSPASWKKVAKKYSSDPTTSSKGGLQKAIPEELLQGPLKKAIFGSATGELVGPIKYQGNYLLLEVDKLNPEKVKSLGEARSQISETLNQQKQQEYVQEFGAQVPAEVDLADRLRLRLRGRRLLQLPGIGAHRESARTVQSLLRSQPERTADRMPGAGPADQTGAAGDGDAGQTERRTVRAAAAAGSRRGRRRRRKRSKGSKGARRRGRRNRAEPKRRTGTRRRIRSRRRKRRIARRAERPRPNRLTPP